MICESAHAWYWNSSRIRSFMRSRYQEFLLRDRFRRQISATNRALHGRGPTRPGPVARKIDVRDRRLLRGSELLGLRRGGEGRALLLHHVRLQQLGILHAREVEPQI